MLDHFFADDDAEDVRRNTAEQNKNLDVVGNAAADIKRLAYVRAESQPRPTCALVPAVDKIKQRGLLSLSKAAAALGIVLAPCSALCPPVLLSFLT